MHPFPLNRAPVSPETIPPWASTLYLGVLVLFFSGLGWLAYQSEQAVPAPALRSAALSSLSGVQAGDVSTASPPGSPDDGFDAETGPMLTAPDTAPLPSDVDSVGASIGAYER
jgi:hypothetical protein